VAHLYADQLVPASSGTFGKSDLFAELYDETVFDHATFADLQRANGPLVIINGTDITTGARFSFTQDQFDAICGDLSQVPLARAVATSTALPPLLTPLPLRTAAGLAVGRRRPGRSLPRLRATGPRRRAAPCFAPARSSPTPIRPARTFTFLMAVSPRISVCRGGQGLGDTEGLSDETELASLRRPQDCGDRGERLRFPEVDWDTHDAPPERT